MSIVYFLLVGLVAGWLAGKIMRGRGFDLVVNMLVGVIGAVIGGYVFGLLDIAAGGPVGQSSRPSSVPSSCCSRSV